MTFRKSTMTRTSAATMLSLLVATGALCAAGSTDARSQSAPWTPRGIGGGGALYSPSINPVDNDEFYVGCDMSGLYHTADFGSSYHLLNFQQIQGGHDARVQFTSNPALLYCITYANDRAVPARSTDGGTTWTPLPGNPDPGETTYSLWADYNNPLRVIMSFYGSIYTSADGGNAFGQVYSARNAGAGVNIGGAFFDGDTTYLGTNDGLLVSTDGGVSFHVLPAGGLGAGERIFSFAGAKRGARLRLYCLTADSGSIYVGISGSDYWGFMKGVYALDDVRGNWMPRMNGITPGTDFPMYTATAWNDTATVYLGGSNSSGVPTIMKSTDGGEHWTHTFLAATNGNIATGWSGAGGDRGWGYGECVFGLGVAPNNPDRVLFTDFGFVHRTSDGGASWQQAYLSAADQNAPGLPTPTGKSYHGIGLEVTSCWQIVWSDANNLFACFSDIKGVRSTDGGLSWSFNYTGHSANTMYRIARNPASGALYGATSNVHDMYQSTRLQDAQLDASDGGGKIISSTDKGAHWSDLHLFGHPVFWLALDPRDPNTMYASVVHSTSGGIFVTHDLQNGSLSSWSKLPNPPRTEGHPASIEVLNDGTVVCTYSGRRGPSGFTSSSGVFRLAPGTTAWTDLSDPGMVYWTKDIVVDPHDVSQNTWYVGVFSGWGGPPNGLGGLYRTIDRGGTWKRIISLDRVTSCTINPSNQTVMYLTTETGGLWHSGTLDASSPAFAPVDGYPFRQPERVFFNPFDDGEVWVSSFGAGMMVGSANTTGVHDQSPGVAHEVVLEENYPNPFNPWTTIRYRIPSRARVTLSVYSLLGQLVKELVNDEEDAGYHDVRFDGSGLASGVYFSRLNVYDVQARHSDGGARRGVVVTGRLLLLR